jgi:methylated-DNA-[protein]-cysteine S-methyltransferase
MTRPIAAFGRLTGPRGPLHVAVTRRGVVMIDLLSPADVFREELEKRLGGPIVEVGPELDGAVLDPSLEQRLTDALAAVRRFLNGNPGALDGLPLDLDDRPAWDRAVLGAVRGIPYGSTSSYGAIARAIGRPGAARAVGGAVGRNPISLAIPCHRVIAGDGGIGGYGGGWWGSRELRVELKRELLAREGVEIPR